MTERIVVLTLFFVSGAVGLVYEVVWARQLSLIFGVTIFAASSVLAAYMGGLALGSYLIGRRIDRSANPVRVYALLEIAIGISALAVPFALEASRRVYLLIAEPLEGHFLLFNLLRALLAFLVLLVPTTLMGGTVPAIGRYLVDRREHLAWNVALLYGLNTLGAVVGCLAAGFVLVPYLGLAKSTWLAVAGNIGIGIVVLAARIGQTRAAAPATRPSAEIGAPIRDGGSARLATAVFAVSGFAALGYEVLWTRVLVVYVHNSTYAFSVMLAMFLAGLAIGNALLMRVYDRIRHPIFALGTVQILVAVSTIAAAVSYVKLGGLSTLLLAWTGLSGWGGAVVLMLIRAALVMLPFTLLLGTIFPLVARIACRDVDRVGESLGVIYAANTGGAILGALAAPFVLIPLFGVRGSIIALASVNVLMGLACWLAEARSPRVRLVAVVTAVVCLIAPHVLISKTIFFDALLGTAEKLVYYYEGVTDTTGVWESRGARIITYGDMRGTAGTDTNDLNRRQAHLAHLLHPRPRRSLQIGFGVGNTLAAAALHPEVERLDCAELSPHVRDTAAYFWTNDDVLANPKVRLIVDDGRNYLLRTRERYEVITLEPPDIFTANVINLYTREFYELASRAMTDDGILVQWIPAIQLPDEDNMKLIRALQDVFPDVSVWHEGASKFYGMKFGPLLIVASKRPLTIDVDELARRMVDPAIRADLESIGTETPAKLLSLFLMGHDGAREWTKDQPAVTDDRTMVDTASARSVYSGYGMGILHNPLREKTNRVLDMARLYQRMRAPVAPLLKGTGDIDAVVAAVENEHREFDRWVDVFEARVRAANPSPAF